MDNDENRRTYKLVVARPQIIGSGITMM